MSVLLSALTCAGCATYESPFVHKSESDLDAMENRDMLSAEAFRSGNLTRAKTINDELTREMTVSTPLYDLERVSLLTIEGNKGAAHEAMMKYVENLDLLYDPESEEKAISLWHGENNKVFKGDNHERATLYALLAMSAIERGEYDDAIRAVKNGLLADTSSDPKDSYTCDYSLLHYLGYVAASYQGDKATALQYKEQMLSLLRERGLNADDPKYTWAHLADDSRHLPNAFIVAWTGTPPEYIRGGEHKEIRYCIPGHDPVQAVTLEVGKGEITAANGLADINFQATTRGKRVMDEVLKDKALVKTGFEASGNILIKGGVACLLVASQQSDGNARAVLFIVGGACITTGLTAYVVGACINPDADVRSWKCIPANFRILPVHLQPGQRTLKLNAYSQWDCVAKKSVTVNIPAQGATFVHVPFMECSESYKKSDLTGTTILKLFYTDKLAHELQ